MVYNLLYYQVVAQVSCGLTGAERARVSSETTPNKIVNLGDALNLINESLGQTDLYMEDDSSSAKPQVNILALEQQVVMIIYCQRQPLHNFGNLLLGSKIMLAFPSYSFFT